MRPENFLSVSGKARTLINCFVFGGQCLLDICLRRGNLRALRLRLLDWQLPPSAVRGPEAAAQPRDWPLQLAQRVLLLTFMSSSLTGRHDMRINLKLPIEWDTMMGSEVHRATEVLRAAHIRTEDYRKRSSGCRHNRAAQVDADIQRYCERPKMPSDCVSTYQTGSVVWVVQSEPTYCSSARDS
jgi:hypothetical protein